MLKRIALLFALVGIAAQPAVSAVYNPTGASKDELATIAAVKRGWTDSARYKIVRVDGKKLPTFSSSFHKFASGIYTIEWVLTNKEDLGVAEYTNVVSRGYVVAKLKPKTKYIIGSNPEPGGGAAVFIEMEDEEKEVVSLNCEPEECEEMKKKVSSGDETLASLRKKVYIQSVLESLRDPVLPNLKIDEE